MRVVECTGDFAGNTHGVSNGQLTFAFQSRAQRLAGDQRHHVVQQPGRRPSCSSGRLRFIVRLSRIQQRQNMRMLQSRRSADLAQEALGAQRRAEVGMQHLDGNVALMLEVVGQIHRGHAAGAEFTLDAISVGERCSEPIEGPVHPTGREFRAESAGRNTGALMWVLSERTTAWESSRARPLCRRPTASRAHRTPCSPTCRRLHASSSSRRPAG